MHPPLAAPHRTLMGSLCTRCGVSRKRRSLVYGPADNRELVARAAASRADAVIVDLESTVPEAAKDQARAGLPDLLAEVDFGDTETVVRINGLRTDRWLADLDAAIDAGADTIRLPKVERAGEVERAVDAARQRRDPPPEFLLQLETPRGFLDGASIAATCADLPTVTGVGIGMGDYTKTIGVPRPTDELRAYLFNRTAAIAAAGGMDPLGYVHKELDDLRAVATTARELGHVGQPVSSTVDPEPFVRVLNDVYGEP